MAQHTPGPWSQSLPDETVVVDADGRDVARMCGDYDDPDAWPVMEANARLAAAAPGLLEALRNIIGQRDLSPERLSGALHLWDDARAVIAKAEGRPS